MLRSCWDSGLGTVPGRSSLHCWDGPVDGGGTAIRGRDGPMSMLVRYSFKPMLADCALVRSRSATSCLRHKPVIPGLGMFSPPFLAYVLLPSLGRWALGSQPIETELRTEKSGVLVVCAFPLGFRYGYFFDFFSHGIFDGSVVSSAVISFSICCFGFCLLSSTSWITMTAFLFIGFLSPLWVLLRGVLRVFVLA